MKTFKNMINKITELTDDNWHGEALIEAAKLITNDRLVKIFTDITEEHRNLGYLPTGLYEMRTNHYRELMLDAKNVLTVNEYKALRGAF